MVDLDQFLGQSKSKEVQDENKEIGMSLLSHPSSVNKSNWMVGFSAVSGLSVSSLYSKLLIYYESLTGICQQGQGFVPMPVKEAIMRPIKGDTYLIFVVSFQI